MTLFSVLWVVSVYLFWLDLLLVSVVGWLLSLESAVLHSLTIFDLESLA